MLNNQYNIWVSQINQGIPNLTSLLGANMVLIDQISTIISLNLQVTTFNMTQSLEQAQSILSQLILVQNTAASLFLTGSLNLADQQSLNQNIQLLQTNIATLTGILNDWATNVSIENVSFPNLTNQIISGSMLNANDDPVVINTSITLKNVQNTNGTYKPITVKILWGTDTITTQTYNDLTNSVLVLDFSKSIPKSIYSNIKSENIQIVVIGINGKSNVYKTNITINAFALYTLKDLYAINNLFLPTDQKGKTFILQNNLEIGDVGTSINAIINNFEGTFDGNSVWDQLNLGHRWTKIKMS
jgi:hypothetical protein